MRIFILNQTLHWFMIGVLVPVATLFLLEKGLDLFEVGVMTALYSAAVIVLEMPTGGLADAVGRKMVYMLSVVALIIAGVVLMVAHDAILLGVGFLLTGVARALSSGSMDAWFVDEFYRVEERSRLQSALALAHFFIPAGLGLSSLIGGWLPQSLGPVMESRLGLNVYSANVVVMTALGGVQLLVTGVLVKETPAPGRSGSFIAGFRAVPQVLTRAVSYGIRERSVFLILLATFAWGVGFSGLERFWQPQFETVAGDRFQPIFLGLLSAGYFFAGSLGSLLSAPAVKLFRGANTTALFALRLLQGILFLWLSFQTGIIGFAVLYVAGFLFHGAQTPTKAAALNTLVPERERSSLLSFQSLFLQLGGMLGSLGMGYLAETASIREAWWVGGGVLLASAVLFPFVREREGAGRSASHPGG